MNTPHTLFIILLLSAHTVAQASVTESLADEVESLQPGESVRVIVTLKDEPDLGMKLAAVEEADMSVRWKRTEKLDVKRKSFGRVQSGVLSRLDSDFRVKYQYQTFNALAGNVTREGLLKLLDDPRVEAVSLDEPVSIALDESVPLINGTLPWNKYYLGRNFTGRDETVCIIDTGIRYTHDYLGDGWGNKVLGGYDYVNGDSNPNDDHGHGTHCAGIVASTHTTWKGVAPDANLIAMKVLAYDGTGSMGDVTSAIQWCTTNADTYNITVISMSLGSNTKFYSHCDGGGEAAWVQAERDAINAATDAGIYVVAASGNEAYTDRMSAPACHRNCTSVGAVYDYDGGGVGWSSCSDNSVQHDIDKVICISNRPSFLDVWAPGFDIYSTAYNSDTAFVSKGGTSMACPHVAGAAAVIQQFNRDRTGQRLTREEINTLFNDSGKQVTRDVTKPRIDVWNSLLNISNTAPSLSDGNVSAEEYVNDTPFTFNVTYTDAENNTPDSIVVTVNGTGYSMSEADSGDADKTDGKRYYRSLYLAKGNYEYNFTASDGFLNDSDAIHTNLVATVRPALYQVAVTPSIGETTDLYNFTVNFTDLDGDAEDSVNLTLDGTVYAMAAAESDEVYSDGRVFYRNLTLAEGTHSYRITADDNRTYNTTVSSSLQSGPRVSGVPSCTGDSPPGIGSGGDWVITQLTACNDSSFIPSSTGKITVENTLRLRNNTIYNLGKILNFTAGVLELNGTVFEFSD